VLEQRFEILPAVPERLDLEAQEVDLLEQRRIEITIARELVEIEGGGGDEAEIPPSAGGPAGPARVAKLEDLAEPGLKRTRELLDPVEEQCAGGGPADPRAPLPFEPGALERRAVDADEWPLPVRAREVESESHGPGLGAGFAQDQGGQRALRGALDEAVGTAQGRAGADQPELLSVELAGELADLVPFQMVGQGLGDQPAGFGATAVEDGLRQEGEAADLDILVDDGEEQLPAGPAGPRRVGRTADDPDPIRTARGLVQRDRGLPGTGGGACHLREGRDQLRGVAERPVDLPDQGMDRVVRFLGHGQQPPPPNGLAE
jgi:hypothetical protein